jgi:hypothetical protein
MIGVYLHEVGEALDFQMFNRLVVAAEHSGTYGTGFRILADRLKRLNTDSMRVLECTRALCDGLMGCICRALQTHSLYYKMVCEALKLLRNLMDAVPAARVCAVEAGVADALVDILQNRWDYSMPYDEGDGFDDESEEDIFSLGLVALGMMYAGARIRKPLLCTAHLAADVVRLCLSAAVWLASMPLEYVTPSKQSRWDMLDYPGFTLSMLTRDGNVTSELLRFLTANIDDALLTRWTLLYGLVQTAISESRCCMQSQDRCRLGVGEQYGWWLEGWGAPRLLAALVSYPGALASIATALQRYPSCRCPAGMLLGSLMQKNAAACAQLTASPEFDVLRAALAAAYSAAITLGHRHVTNEAMEIPDVDLRAAEGSNDAEDTGGKSMYALTSVNLILKRHAEAEAEAWARRVAAADAAAAALLAEEEAEAAPKGRAAVAAAAASGKKKKAGSSARRRAKAAAAVADAGASLAGLELNDDRIAAPAHEDDDLCIVCLDAPRDTALACCGDAHPPLLCADCAAALLARASGGPACPVRCSPQP